MKAGRQPIVVQLGPREFAVLVHVRDEDGVPVYEIRQRDIKDASVAATVAHQLTKEVPRDG